MHYRQAFFIEGKLLGFAQRGMVLRAGMLHEPSSDLYFCRLCGEVFAQFPCTTSNGSLTEWQSYAGICKRCGKLTGIRHARRWPGSIWRSWDQEFLAALPPAVLHREFQLHLEVFTIIEAST